MKYSFVLPAYKSAFLRESIDSILDQTYSDFELIVVNDASPENLDSIVNSYDDPRIQYYVNEENIGGKDLVAQWNHSISYAKGEYLILASDDDIYDSRYLEKMDRLISKYPDVNVFRSRIQQIDAENNPIYIFGYIPEFTSQSEFCYYWMSKYIGSGIPYYIIKREELLKIGGYINLPSAWCSDDATVLLLSSKGVVCSSDILFSFRMSGLNISSVRNDYRLLRNKILATSEFNKWFSTYIERLDVFNEEDQCYASVIARRFISFRRQSFYEILTYSSFFALLFNIRLIRENKCVSFKSFLYLLVNSFRG